MVELNSLHLQLENLKILQEEAMLKSFSIHTLKMLSSQIKEVEKAIAERTNLLNSANGPGHLFQKGVQQQVNR